MEVYGYNLKETLILDGSCIEPSDKVVSTKTLNDADPPREVFYKKFACVNEALRSHFSM